MDNNNVSAVAVMHVFALGKSWPISEFKHVLPPYQTVQYVYINEFLYTGDTVEELQQQIDEELER